MPLPTPEKDRILAAVLTFLCVLAILLALFFGGLSVEKEELAQYSVPEFIPQSPEFYEPDFIPSESQEIQEGQTTTPDNQIGTPFPATRPQRQNREPESNIITDVPPEEFPYGPYNGPDSQSLSGTANNLPNDSALSSFMKAAESISGSFKPVDIHTRKKPSAVGHDPFTEGIVGTAPGRLMLSCPKPYVASLKRRVIITVDVTIDAEGNVVRAIANGDADASLRKKCEEAARNSQWNAKKDAPALAGTIIFTLNP